MNYINLIGKKFRNIIEVIDILNVDQQKSTISTQNTPFQIETNNSYIVSESDPELLILIEFKCCINLESMQIYALSMNDDDISPPKHIHIYKANNLSIDFGDLPSMKPDKSVECKLEKLEKLKKGQKINFKTMFKFKSIQYLVVYIQSNQNGTERTSIHSIMFRGHIANNVDIGGTGVPCRVANGFDDDSEKKDEETDNEQECQTNSCKALKRLAEGYTYYESSSFGEPRVNNYDRFIKYCDNYKGVLLDDWHHFVKQHTSSQQIIEISKELVESHGAVKCDAIRCNALRRHYRMTERDSNLRAAFFRINDTGQGRYNFYIKFYDRLHHQILHVFETGLKLKPCDEILHETKEDDDEDCGFECINKQFENIRDKIKGIENKNHLVIERYKCRTDRFNLDKSECIYKAVEGNSSFLDVLQAVFINANESNKNMTSYEMKVFWEYIDVNQYDTDSLSLDVMDECDQSNIYKDIGSKSCVDLVREHVRNKELIETSFATGISFNYEKEEIADDSKKDQFVVSQRYDSIKQEILESGHLDLEQWSTHIIFKADRYFQTKIIKQKDGLGVVRNQCKSMPRSYLLCIILYCDWSDLCTDLSNTYRKQYPFESMKSVGYRHSKYYHFAKTLGKAVNEFGTSGIGKIRLPEQTQDYEFGPFFTGLSSKLLLPSFAICLKGPCSTSKDLPVAVKFATEGGIIVQLGNEMGMSFRQKFFDCSWISDFTEENERLFVAGTSRLKVESVTIIESGQDFKKCMHALYVFDAMISGFNCNRNDQWCLGIDDISETDKEILRKLIYRDTTYVDDIDPYIVDTFDLFLNTKTEITINIHHLATVFKNISDLLMYCIGDQYRYNEHRYDNKLNVLDPGILHIFPNLRQVTVNTTFAEEDDTLEIKYRSYKFDLVQFLSSVQSKPSIKYVIKAESSYKYSEQIGDVMILDESEKSWLSNILDKDTSITEEYSKKQFKIEQKVERNSGVTDILIIKQLP